MAQLETSLGCSPDVSKPRVNVDGWKTLSNWRQLSTVMTPGDIRRLLGEPIRINGGDIATWHYQNRGYVTFMNNRLYSWSEPK